jgi:hypothetical protein
VRIWRAFSDALSLFCVDRWPSELQIIMASFTFGCCITYCVYIYIYIYMRFCEREGERGWAVGIDGLVAFQLFPEVVVPADEREGGVRGGVGWFFRRKERVKLTFMWGDKIEASGAVFNYKGTPSFLLD